MLKKLLELIPQEREKLYDYTKKQAEREALLRKITEIVKNSLDINEIINPVCKEIPEIFDVQRVVITDFTRKNDGKFHSSYYNTDNYIKSSSILSSSEQENVYKYAREVILEKNTNFIINNLLESAAPENYKKTASKLGVKSALGVPIRGEGKVWGGIFVVDCNKYRHWSKGEITLLEAIANKISIALRQAELYSETKKQAEREKFIREIVEATSSSLDSKEIQNKLVTLVAKRYKPDKCFIRSFDNELDKFLPVQAHAEYFSSPDLNKSYCFSEEIETLVKSEYKKGHDFIVPSFEEFLQKPEPFCSIGKRQIEYYGILANYCFPLIIENKLIGAFVVQFKEKTYLDSEEVNVLRIVVGQAAISLKQAELYAQTQKQAEREALLRQILETVRSSLNINEIKGKLVNQVGKAFKADKCFFWDYDDKRKNFIHKISFDYVTSPDLRKPYTYGKETDDFLIETYKKQGYIHIYDFSKHINEPGHMGNISRHQTKYHKIKTNCCFGLFDGNKFLGAFAIQYKEPTHLYDEDIELLKSIVNQASIAMKQARQHERIKKQAKREAFLREIIETVGGSLELEAVLNAICAKVFELFEPDRVAIENYPDKGNYKKWAVTSQYTAGPDILGVNDIQYSQKTKEYLGIKMLEEGMDIVADDIEKADLPDYFIDTHKKMNIKSFIAVPLKKNNHKWGVLALSQVHKYRKWTKAEIQLLHTVADQAYIAIRQAELYEKSQEATKLKNEFITNMSHEIRTPLNSILGFSQLLGKSDCTEEKQQKYLNNISLSANHLLELVNSILNFSKIESGEMSLCIEKFDLANTIKEIISSIKSMAIQKNITINTEIPEITLEADTTKLKQILLNLLSNAIKFTSENGQITIRTKSKKNELIIEVEDTGIGIAEEDKDKIFKYFSQVDSSHSRNQEGTGLGLIIAKKLVELHNGTIHFESKKGKGSKFWFTLPKSKALLTPKI